MKTWEEFLKAGGEWIGSARAWMQRKKINGSRVTWGSDEALEPPMLVREVEDMASNASWAAYKMGYEEGKKVADLQVGEAIGLLRETLVVLGPVAHWARSRAEVSEKIVKFLEKPVGEKPRDRNKCYCGGGTEHCKMCGAEPCKCAEKRK
jgi:hypothetical protein